MANVYVLCLILFLVGLYGVLSQKNLIKLIIGLAIMEYAVNLLLIMVGYRQGGSAPILERGTDLEKFLSGAVDPLPQAMVLTSIVIGLGLTALMVAMAIRLHEKYGTFDMNKVRKLRG